MLKETLTRTRAARPLVHCITNFVTANDCANLLLACGASPIMADDPQEAAEITSACQALVLNLGTPSPRRIEAMLAAGREANRLGHPIVFDPVGVGSSGFRMEAASALLRELRLCIIRANAGEIHSLCCGAAGTRGVDTDAAASVKESRALARETGAVVVCTGETDIVTDGQTAFRVYGGHPMTRLITGAGCQTSALAGAFAAVNPPLEAALGAACAMKRCAQIAHARLGPQEGSASLRSYLIDAVCLLRPQDLKDVRYDIL